jgi:hypothetical protein
MPSGIRKVGLALLLVFTGSLALGATAGAAPLCRQQVIEDWSDNGRVDRIYPLDCYEQAIQTMPPEIRDYTDAHDVIDRALTLAVRSKGGTRESPQPAHRELVASAAGTSGSTAIPTSLFVLGAIGLGGALGVCAFAYASQRRALGRGGPPG